MGLRKIYVVRMEIEYHFSDYPDSDTTSKVVGIFRDLETAKKFIKQKFGIEIDNELCCYPYEDSENTSKYICIDVAYTDLI